ncbi:MAG: SDR family NAD(P)-dependent oxidoreductase [Myxococcota bacterium]
MAHDPVLVTGASRGIGAAVAAALSAAGWPVVLNARSAGPLREVAARCGDAPVVVGDCADEGVVRAMVDAAGPRLGGFVHNAAVGLSGPLLWETDAAAARAVYDVNVTAGLHLARLALPRMAGGFAVIVGSGAAARPIPGMGAYCVAKAAAEHLARQIAAERPDVLAFVFRPGVVDTQMQAEARESAGGAGEALRGMFRGYQQQGLLTQPEEVAAVLVDAVAAPHTELHGGLLDAHAVLRPA